MVVIMVGAAAAVWIGLNRTYKAPSPMRCLPRTTAFVARLGDRATLAAQSCGTYGNELIDVTGGDAVRGLAARIDTLFAGDVISGPSLDRRDLYVSFSLTPSGKICQLAAAFRLNNRMEWHKAMNELRDREGVTVSDTSVRGHGLFLLREKGYKAPLFMAAGGGCLFASTTPDLLLSFGRDSVVPMCDDPLFAQIERTVSPSAPASIFINGRAFARVGDKAPALIGSFANGIRLEGKGGDWLALDLGMDDEGLSADGFAVGQRQSLSMLTSRECSSAMGLARRLPKGAKYFHRIGAGRRGMSSPAFSDFLSQDTIGSQYRTAQSDLFARTGVDIEALLAQVFESELALCSYSPHGAKDGQDFLVVDTHGGTKAHAVITQALTALHGGAAPMVIGEIQPGGSAVPEGVISRRADAEMVSDVSVPVYAGFNNSDNTFFLNLLFGEKVPGRLFFRYEDALVFADDMATLRRVLADYVTGNTMEGFQQFDALMSHFGNDRATFTFDAAPVSSIGRCPFASISHQMTRTGNLPYISIFARARTAETERSVEQIEVGWRTRVDSIMGDRIWGVGNHYTRLTECLTQDADGKICLIGADGMLLWRRPVDGPIVGEVEQIDFYGNGKLQYLFSTEKTIYIIDRLGNDVGPFPVRLPSKSISGASHAQYSDGSPMRIFVGCEVGPIVFGPDGVQVDGWRTIKTEGRMHGAPRHMVCAQKDFIVYHDQYSYYYADRRGNKRLATAPLAPGMGGEMTVSADGKVFVTTSSDGNIITIDGNSGNLSTLRLDSIGREFISKPLSASSYIVFSERTAYIVSTAKAEPEVTVKWRTDLKSVSQVEGLDGLIIALDAADGQAHVYTSIDGCEIAASPFKARGSVALGHGKDGIVAYTLGESGEIIQVNLTKSRAR